MALNGQYASPTPDVPNLRCPVFRRRQDSSAVRMPLHDCEQWCSRLYVPQAQTETMRGQEAFAGEIERERVWK